MVSSQFFPVLVYQGEQGTTRRLLLLSTTPRLVDGTLDLANMLGKWLSATSSRSLPVLRREQGSIFKSMLRANRHSFGWNHDGDATFRATTICSVRKDGMVAVVGDGQVSMGSTIAKPNAKKVRRVNTGKSEILVGFAGGTADAMSLLDRLEKKLDQYPDQLTRACVELAKDWRTERYMRHLQATMIVADTNHSYTITGNGDVFDSTDGVIAIGSGGPYALAAARALIDHPTMNAEEIAHRALQIASEICVYTNNEFVVETLEKKN